jgi:hypothetical protein
MIVGVLVFNDKGQTRLMNFYQQYVQTLRQDAARQQQLIQQIQNLLLDRHEH